MKVKLRKCLKEEIVIVIILVLCTVVFNYYKYTEYTKNYNYEVNAIINVVLEKYPDIDENELIKVLNEDKNYDKTLLEKYGIDLNKDSLVASNDRLLISYLVVDSLIVIIFFSIGIWIFIRYNSNKNREINEITKLVEQINQRNYKLDIDNISEEELSILKNEIYKTTIMLKEQAMNACVDKENLKNSLSDISHQLKTPLTSIMITLDNILDNPDMEKDTREKFIIKIKREITNINFLVRNILKLSKFEANAIVFVNEDVMVNEIIHEAIENVSSLCDLKNVVINYEDKDIKLNCDLKWQIEAITNILKNSIEHSLDDSKIDVMVRENKMYKEIIIKDYGIGIDKNDIGFIFDRFYKGRNSSKDSVGIGLSLAKNIIEQSNGIIMVKSKKNVGTTFTIKYYLY